MNIHETNGRSVTEGLPKRTWTLLPPRATDPDNEFIYFGYSAGRVKIGYSRGMDRRRSQWSSAGSFPPVIFLVIHGTVGDEQDLHVLFHPHRLHGEWFVLSQDLRDYLRPRLCDIGRSTLDCAEAVYREECEYFLANYKEPPRRSARPHCEHGMPVGSICAPCERQRDLAVLERLNAND